MSELYEEMAEAMKRRTRAQNALVKWEESLHDAESDIRELSARIAQEHGSFVQVPSAPGEHYDIPVNNGVEEI